MSSVRLVLYKDSDKLPVNLGKWLSNVRCSIKFLEQGKRGNCPLLINDAQLEMLEKIGFHLERARGVEKVRSFDENFKNNLFELANFKAEHGHIDVPNDHDLYSWIQEVISLKKKSVFKPMRLRS